MSDLIVSYDGTANDEDALALAALLAPAGFSLALAYVRHARDWDPRREEIAQHDAELLLERGALGLPDPDIPRHVVIDPSTPAGLLRLAESEGARVVVFGSEYRTSPGRAEPGTSAQTLIEGGSVAVAVAAAGLRASRNAALRSVALATEDAGAEAVETVEELAAALGAAVTPAGADADLIVAGSGAGAAAGRVGLGGAARAALNALRGSVIVLPGGTALVP